MNVLEEWDCKVVGELAGSMWSNTVLFIFIDISFDVQLEINNRTVRCSGEAKGSYYPSPMYTCAGIRLVFCYNQLSRQAGRPPNIKPCRRNNVKPCGRGTQKLCGCEYRFWMVFFLKACIYISTENASLARFSQRTDSIDFWWFTPGC